MYFIKNNVNLEISINCLYLRRDTQSRFLGNTNLLIYE